MATKIIITRKNDDVVTNIVNTARVVENGLLVTDQNGEYIIGFYSECNRFDNVETPDTIIPQKYKYTTANGFVEDPTYKPFVSTEDQIASLQAQLLQTQSAVNSLLGV